MKNQQKKHCAIRAIILILLCLIVNSNIPLIQFFSLDNYHYRNADDRFTYTEFPGKGLDCEIGISGWDRSKSTHPNNPNKILCSNFRINPLKFRQWRQFIAYSSAITSLC